MPSHIFLQLGLWDEVVASNQRSWRAARAGVAQGPRGVQALDWHILHWLQYGYLQQGRYAAAAAVIDTAEALLRGISTDTLRGYPDVRYIAGMLSFQYGAETGRWDAYLRLGPDPAAVARRMEAASTPREQGFAAVAAYQAGMGALLGGRDTAAAAAISRNLHASATALAEGDARRVLLQRLAAQLDAWLAWVTGDREAAIAMAGRLAAEVRESPFSPMGQPAFIPTFEVLGAFLLQAGRGEEAATAYAQALIDRPNRPAALLGLARAKTAIGDSAGAAEAYALLLGNWGAADPDIPARMEAQTALAGTSRR
jgi:hypothetical protein